MSPKPAVSLRVQGHILGEQIDLGMTGGDPQETVDQFVKAIQIIRDAAVDVTCGTPIVELIARIRPTRGMLEVNLQTTIADILTVHRVPFVREVVLSKKDRIDFLCDKGVGIEVKVGKAWTPSRIENQLCRYAESERVSELILVSDRKLSPRLDEFKTVNGKPFHNVWLSKNLGIGV